MGQEIELKLRIHDHDDLRRKLQELDAKFRGRRFEINTFFDADDKLKSAGNGLRLRSMRDEAGVTQSVITYKGPATGDAVRSREEIEFSIDDFEAATALLSRLGYTPTIAFEKRRETWSLDGCLVEFDELPRLGTFVEIEGDDEERVERVRTALGLVDAAPVMSGYASLVTRLLDAEPQLGTMLRFA